MVGAIANSTDCWPEKKNFNYFHGLHLQDEEFGYGKPYLVRLTYSDSGGEGHPIIAIGGITNVIQRFDFLSMDAAPEVRVISLDLAGRGLSGWLVELSDYHLDSYVEQLSQLMDALELDSCSLLGSSLGGSTALAFAARFPNRVRSIVLNDSGPYIPVERRSRRAKVVARHYVFQNPAQMFKRTGASEKHAGPTLDAVLLHTAHSKTRWSEEEDGRVYRHDLRALLAYRAESTQSLDLWHYWSEVRCPVLVIHGMLSDALEQDTLDRMRAYSHLSVIHVEDTGHTPTLSDFPLNQKIVNWILNQDQFEDAIYRIEYSPPKVIYPDV